MIGWWMDVRKCCGSTDPIDLIWFGLIWLVELKPDRPVLRVEEHPGRPRPAVAGQAGVGHHGRVWGPGHAHQDRCVRCVICTSSLLFWLRFRFVLVKLHIYVFFLYIFLKSSAVYCTYICNLRPACESYVPIYIVLLFTCCNLFNQYDVWLCHHACLLCKLLHTYIRGDGEGPQHRAVLEERRPHPHRVHGAHVRHHGRGHPGPALVARQAHAGACSYFNSILFWWETIDSSAWGRGRKYKMMREWMNECLRSFIPHYVIPSVRINSLSNLAAFWCCI